jgi:hypothetical protein
MLGVGVVERRRKTEIVLTRVNGDRHRLHDWVVNERALMLRQHTITITPEFSDISSLDIAAVSIHAIGRAFQRMPQVNDTLILQSLRPLVQMWPKNGNIGEEFTCNGWRGVVLWQENTSHFARTDCNGDRVMHLLGVRTYFDTQD